MPKEITVSTMFAEYDGLINITFKDESSPEQKEKRIENIPIAEEFKGMNSQLNADEQEGTAFLNGIRRYIQARHGVTVSTESALKYYTQLNNLIEETQKLFYPTQDVPDSMGKTSETSQFESSTSLPDSSEK